MVLLCTRGLAQKPIDNIKIKGTTKKNKPVFKLDISPINPTIKGIIAPPAIPVHNIPDRDPWWYFTELSASEKMMDHITEIQNPSKGKAITAIDALPVSANIKQIIVAAEAPIKSFLLSMIFKRANPSKHPKVSIAQK